MGQKPLVCYPWSMGGIRMTLEEDEEYEETPSEALEPGVKGMETPLQEDTDEVKDGEPSGEPTTESNWQEWYLRLAPLLGYLPTGEHEEDTERDGLLSYSVEVHVFAFGLSAGIAAASTGNMQLVMTVVGVALGIGRLQQPQTITETVREQIVKEPAYALGGAAIGWAVVHYDLLAQTPIGV